MCACLCYHHFSSNFDMYFIFSHSGYVIANVTATDGDGTKPNNDFIYRIESGAFDKFRINFETGIVEVEKKADLDREKVEDFELSISAVDRGMPVLTGYCILKVIM